MWNGTEDQTRPEEVRSCSTVVRSNQVHRQIENVVLNLSFKRFLKLAE
jgi:hypothetical protein